MSDFYNYHDDNQEQPIQPEQTSNDYNYYSQTTEPEKRSYSPYDIPEPGTPKKKKGGFGMKLVKAVCLGLAFGLAAGGAFWGFARATGITVSEGGRNSNTGMNVNIVRTSATDVETINATDVSDIVKEAMPSIVAVNTQVVTTSNYFGQTYSQEGSGAGSGIIMSEADGILYIMTNYHVIEDSTSIQITFDDDSTADAEIKGYDENADIAVLTIDYNSLSDETKSNIAAAVMGDSDALDVGNGAIAIGNALGYGQSVTTGAISAVDREVQMTDGTVTLIQTDAAINPGNSGGALLNTRGEVIGVNTVKYSDTSVEGMGFAIPINDALETAQGIIDGTIVTKTDENTAYLGISGGTLDEESARSYGYPAGVYVSMVSRNSAAERAGLQQGDVITGFDGEDISTMEQLQELLADHVPGDEIVLTVQRQRVQGDFTEMELSTILGSKADVQ
ncbi:MAG: PDZ domain-containing protein [Clostridia bacterium]|nr:trypsin-like peptidase domain-containing protein [Lachnospiraceae bacterium]NCB99819.1 PDZ domain-containing protein [Clostridia bacterium]NCD01966.1 PDZ domain-containing protein [Clostridia bacterium]